MLTHITMKNFAIAADLSLELGAGMTVLTGETGAGKSIFIEAIHGILGGRADQTVVKPGADKAELTASFSLVHIPEARDWLEAQDLGEGDECLLRRSIAADGRSKYFINGVLCTQTQVRQLAECLVNIHSQHENQQLLQRDYPQRIVDELGHHGALLKSVSQAYEAWRASTLEKEALQNQQAHPEEALIQHQLEELRAAAIQPNEEASLSVEQKQLANADFLLQQSYRCLGLLEEEEENNLQTLVTSLLKQFHPVINLDPVFQPAFQHMEEALNHLTEASAKIRHRVNQFERDPERLNQVEERLGLIHALARKYRVKPTELPQVLEQLEEKYLALSHREERLLALEKLLVQQAEVYREAAARLTDSRLKTAAQLKVAILEQMALLGMPQAQFEIEFEKQLHFSPHGLEKPVFLVSANPGQPVKPLHKVASGGEISRINLAIQVISAQADNIPTLIFDEIDVGISGGMAERIGTVLKKLGRTAQVVCVTHLPQVAAQGDHHLHVFKTQLKDQTVSRIVPLDEEQKIEEIARLLGGLVITPQTLAHAREMCHAAKSRIELN